MLFLLSALMSTVVAAQQIVGAEYFIGADPGPGNGVPLTVNADNSIDINSSLATSQLSTGVNSIAIRTKSSAGIWSNTVKRNFYVEPSTVNGDLLFHEIIAAEYFIDNDPGPGNGTPIDITQATAAEFEDIAPLNLTNGFHKLSVRVLSTSGLWSSTVARQFILRPASAFRSEEFHEVVAAEYFVGADPGVGQGTAIDLAPGTDVDIIGSLVADMAPGVYKLAIRTQSSAGLWSSTVARIFIVKPVGGVNTFYEITAAEYFIDTDPGEGLGTPISITSGTSVVTEGTVPTTGLALGLHTMGIRFKGNTGIWCAAELAEFTIAGDVPLTYTVTLGSPTCPNAEDGFITLNVTSDPSQFTYNWNGEVGGPSIDEIPSGNYQLQVDNLFGDLVLDTLITLEGPDTIVIDATINDALCNGDANGSIDATATGGTGPFEFDWGTLNPGAIAAGTYTVFVTDANGCVESQEFVVNEPTPLSLVLISTTPVTDEVNCNGAIDTGASGGTPGYSIVWNDPATQMSFAPGNLCVGSYEGTVTDDNGCTTTLTVELLPSNVQEQLNASIGLSVGPNPTSGAWSILFDLITPQTINIDITDANGRLVLREGSVVVPSGRSQRQYDWSDVASGQYHVRISAEGVSESLRLTVE
jgi:hypothetical protein